MDTASVTPIASIVCTIRPESKVAIVVDVNGKEEIVTIANNDRCENLTRHFFVSKSTTAKLVEVRILEKGNRNAYNPTTIVSFGSTIPLHEDALRNNDDIDITETYRSEYETTSVEWLREVTEIQELDLRNITSAAGMFMGCHHLLSVGMLHNTNRLVSTEAMFAGCTKLQSVDLFDTSNVVSMKYMFDRCVELHRFGDPDETGMFHHFNIPNVKTLQSAFADCRSMSCLPIGMLSTALSVEDVSRLFYGCTSVEDDGDGDDDFADVIAPTVRPSWNPELIPSQSITTCRSMFEGCTSLKRLFRSFDTSKVVDMGRMFAGCAKLEVVPAFVKNSGKAKWMNGMFAKCKELTEVTGASFDTSSAKNLREMFKNCKKLVRLGFAFGDTSHVETMDGMFQGCGALTEWPIFTGSLANVVNMSSIFEKCRSLTGKTGDRLVLETSSKLQTLESAFAGCSGFETFPIVFKDLSGLKNARGAFSSCTKLSSRPIGFPLDADTTGAFNRTACDVVE